MLFVKTFQHKFKHIVPAFEEKIPGQRSNIVEKSLAGRKFLSQQSVLIVAVFECGIEKERQQIRRH